MVFFFKNILRMVNFYFILKEHVFLSLYLFHDFVCSKSELLCQGFKMLQFYGGKKSEVLPVAPLSNSGVIFKILVIRAPTVKAMGLKEVVVLNSK
jgi:hypothetical protein